jgi:uncharacterized protein HemY
MKIALRVKAVLCKLPENLAIAWRSGGFGKLGRRLSFRGKFDKAIETLLASLKIAEDINLSGYRSSVLNSLGNTYFSKAQLNETAC